MPNPVTAADLQGLEALVVAEPTFLDAQQQTVIDGVADRTVTWLDRERLFELVPRQITVTGAPEVLVLPRTRAGDPDAPFVCHILNTSYAPDTDSMRLKQDFSITLADSLFGAAITRAVLLVPGGERVEVAVRRAADATEITVPELDLWAVLKLEHARGRE
jgi:hypothetical protein